MKRAAKLIGFLFFLMIVLSSVSLCIEPVSAQNGSYSISKVDHQVEIMDSGHVIIRDKIYVTGQLSGGFLMGFPYTYGANLLEAMAYDADKTYAVSLGEQMEGHVGFYGVKVDFGQSNPSVFTVVFVLSNKLVSEVSNVLTGSTIFTLDFPAYPSFMEDVGSCNVTIVLPVAAQSITVKKDDGEIQTSSYVRANLPAFTYARAEAKLTLAIGYINVLTVNELDRQIAIGSLGEVAVTDNYLVTSKMVRTIGSLNLGVPIGALNVVARDEFGRLLTTSTLSSSTTSKLLNVTLASTLDSGKTLALSLSYSLPSASSEGSRFTLDFVHFPDFDYYVEKARVTFVPLEGAKFISPSVSELDSLSSLNRDVFQEKLSFGKEGISYVDYEGPSENVLSVTYDYNPLWIAFRPTMWAWVIVVVGAAVFAVLRRPKASAPERIVGSKGSVSLSPDQVRSFTEAYAEKNRLTEELKSLEVRAQKGKIPRRQYKVQKRTLEVRSEALSKQISGLKANFRSAGGVNADLIRQLDMAEVELAEAETNIGKIEVRQSRGDIPLETYKKQLTDFQRRKEKAETSINGIMLRLREEL